MSEYIDIEEKLNEFLKITIKVQEKDIKILLFGSLGLSRYLKEDLNVDDIDILISREYVTDKWEELKSKMEGMGYFLQDLHEHQFYNGKYKVAFAPLEDLESFANIKIKDIPIVKTNEVEYLLLTLKQYLDVYKKSSKDSYRRNKNNDKDFLKIQLIEKNLRNISIHQS
ncbi:MAG: hypothetical protein ACRDAU_14055 [Clostridium sp.]